MADVYDAFMAIFAYARGMTTRDIYSYRAGRIPPAAWAPSQESSRPAVSIRADSKQTLPSSATNT